MSRIGKQRITVPAGVEVKIGTDVVEVKGPKGTLHTPVCSLLNYDLTDGVLTLTRVEDNRHSRAQHGLRRTLLANCIEGVTKGFSKSLEVIGVGYRVAVKGNLVELSVGFSHPVLVELPEGIQAKAEGQILTISGDRNRRSRLRTSRNIRPHHITGFCTYQDLITVSTEIFF